MADQHDKRDAETNFPIGGGGVKDVKKLNIKKSFRSLSSPRKVDKGRLQNTIIWIRGDHLLTAHQSQFVGGTVSATAVVERGRTNA
jgi:hypothetical protein